jgi:steroid delta-isomerase-like uncharacterized protein
MKRKEIEAILAEWLEAWRHRDAVALTAPYAEDANYNSMLAGTIRGHQPIESLYRSWFAAFPDMTLGVEGQLIDGNQAVIIWSQRGKHMGEFCGLAGTGRSFVVQGVFFMTFHEGRITTMRSLYDFTGLLVQLGVLKAKPAI